MRPRVRTFLVFIIAMSSNGVCSLCLSRSIFMATLWNRAGHYILPCGFFFYISIFFSSPNFSRRRLDIYTWCGISANLGCRFETCCTRLAENAKIAKKSPSGHHRTILSGYSFAPTHVSTIEKNC